MLDNTYGKNISCIPIGADLQSLPWPLLLVNKNPVGKGSSIIYTDKYIANNAQLHMYTRIQRSSTQTHNAEKTKGRWCWRPNELNDLMLKTCMQKPPNLRPTY